ncbi:hypothetical protein ABEF95_000333, partial [Exophiala dermatitidis]
DDKNFPPLPLQSNSRTPPLHSRVSSFHSLHSSGIRSTTPRIPPGFELTHAHPVPPSPQATPAHANQTGARATPSGSVTVTPAIPLVHLGPRTSTPKPKAPGTPKEGDEEHSLAVRKQRNGVNEISFGSPQLRTSRVKAETEIKKSETSEVESEKEKKDEAPAPVKTADLKGKQKAADTKLEEIELPPITTVASKAPLLPAVPDKPATPVLDSGSVGTPGALSSRPATPASVTTPSGTPKVSTARPRTLRLTTGTTTKPAEPAPASAAPEKTIAAFPPLSAAKKGSRRPSLSSAQHSRPSTPAVSERQHSHDASRASSPPHSIVGSAPERVKSKSQQKKDRKEKAKKSTETGEASVNIPTPPIVEEVAPVIARQKKQKKRVESNTAANMDDSTKTREKSEQTGSAAGKPEAAAAAGGASTDSGSKDEHSEKDKKDSAAPEKTGGSVATPPPSTPKEEPASKAEDTTKTPYTLRDLYTEADKLGKNTDAPGVVQKLLQEHVSSMPKIISSMIQSGDLSKDHPWLNPQSFNSAAYKLPPDSRRGQDYLDGNGYAPNDAFGYIYLPLKEKQALKDGHAVSVADAGDRKDDLLRRCLVTPNGWVLRHLTADESEKVLELEERRQMYVEEFGEVGTMDGLGVLEADDYTNLGGGMEKLSRHGERHGVIWVVGDGEQVGEEDEFDTLDDEDEDDEVGEVGISDEEEPILDDDAGLNEADDAALDGHQGVNMPGAWQSSSTAPNLAQGKQQPAGRASKGKLPALPAKGPHPQSLPHRHSNASSSQNVNNVNLRALDSESLQKRVAEKQKELEQSRKDMEKIEKLWNKKSKDIARWREGLAAKG